MASGEELDSLDEARGARGWDSDENVDGEEKVEAAEDEVDVCPCCCVRLYNLQLCGESKGTYSSKALVPGR